MVLEMKNNMKKCYICGVEKEHMFIDSPDVDGHSVRICSWECHFKLKEQLGIKDEEIEEEEEE